MSAQVHARAEVEKLARVLGVEPERLGELEGCNPKDVRKLRHQVADSLLEADKRHFARVAAAAKAVPAALGAKLAQRALGPLLAARAAALLEDGQAMEITRRLPPSFLADVAIELDPRHAKRALLGTPPERIAEAAAELDARGEHVAMSGFVAYLSEDALDATLEVLSDDALLRVGFLLEAPQRLDGIVASLPDERVTALIEMAAGEGRWSELLGIGTHLKAKQRRRMAGLVEQAGVLASLRKAIKRDPALAEAAKPFVALAA